jgi:hypothetical protein
MLIDSKQASRRTLLGYVRAMSGSGFVERFVGTNPGRTTTPEQVECRSGQVVQA